MKDKNCTNCFNSKWQIHPSGRRKFNSPGECTFSVPVLPHSMINTHRNMPEKRYITRDTKPNCPCWKKENKI